MSPVVPPISVMTTSALVCSASCVDAVLDFVGDVRDHLHGFAEVIAFALVVEHRLVNLAAGEVVEPRELGVGEPFVMAEVEIGFRAVVEHINFAVLVRAHRAGIDVQVGIELLQRDFEPAILQQRAERGRRQALAQRTHHAARDKNVFHLNLNQIHGSSRSALIESASTRLNSASTRATSAGTSTPTLS